MLYRPHAIDRSGPLRGSGVRTFASLDADRQDGSTSKQRTPSNARSAGAAVSRVTRHIMTQGAAARAPPPPSRRASGRGPRARRMAGGATETRAGRSDRRTRARPSAGEPADACLHAVQRRCGVRHARWSRCGWSRGGGPRRRRRCRRRSRGRGACCLKSSGLPSTFGMLPPGPLRWPSTSSPLPASKSRKRRLLLKSSGLPSTFGMLPPGPLRWPSTSSPPAWRSGVSTMVSLSLVARRKRRLSRRFGVLVISVPSLARRLGRRHCPEPRCWHGGRHRSFAPYGLSVVTDALAPGAPTWPTRTDEPSMRACGPKCPGSATVMLA